MKVLLDECLPIDFRHDLPGHVVHTAEWSGFKGLKNGLLLQGAEDAGYDVLLTIDQGVPHQQNLAGRRIAIVVVCARTNQLEDLLLKVEAILAALARGSTWADLLRILTETRSKRETRYQLERNAGAVQV